jgi:micrococcal nuclease
MFLCGTAACQTSMVCAALRNHDGDTLTADCSGIRRQIRLSSVDAPELAQEYGEAAQEFTEALTAEQQITLTVHETDKYGRTVAGVTLPDGRDLARELVRAGLAWHYVKYSRDPELALIEADARKAHRGLWAQATPQNPADFRHGSGNGTKTVSSVQVRSRIRRSEKRTLVAGR